MSSFIYGDFLLPNGAEICRDKRFFPMDGCEFTLQIWFEPNGFYMYSKLVSDEFPSIPFVISDSIYDNTAEVLLSPEYAQFCLGKGYKECKIPPLEDRAAAIAGLVDFAKEALRATGCVLAISDSGDVPENFSRCNINTLENHLITLIKDDEFFPSGGFIITW